MKENKPLGRKAYGSIAHLPNSRIGIGDHKISEGQATIACIKTRDKHDRVIVQEKLDGSNVAVAKINGEIVPLTRSGYIANTSKFEQHQYFYLWALKNAARFNNLLGAGERVCGEWLQQAHATRYDLNHEPFVAFDIMQDIYRHPWEYVERHSQNEGFITPYVLHHSVNPISVNEILPMIEASHHGAIDPVEGAVWRVERKGEVDFLCKYVRPEKKDGIYLPEISGKDAVWNCRSNGELF